jgi:phosphoglycerol transferase MdoB-like AlkP superfamily enzyme
MKQLIKKYTVLVISAMILSRLLTVIILTIWPNLLTIELLSGEKLTLGNRYLTSALDFLINIVFIILLAKEMNEERIKSIPILILTFFSSLLGVIFFFFISAYKKIEIIKTNRV